MSKRKRRNSRKRKSSCSMKQTISSYSFQKTIKSPLDYVVKEDHTGREKGEADSFCKEIFLSDEEEKETEYEQEKDGYKKEKASITGQIDDDRKLRITHSVTFNDFGRSPAKIVFQSSDEFAAEEAASIVVKVTTSKVKYASSDLRLEISDMVQSDNADVSITLILQNEKEKETERQRTQTPNIKCFIQPYTWNQCTRTFKQNAKHSEYVSFKVMTELKTNEDSSRNPSSLSSQEEMDCCKSCCKDHLCRPHTGGHTDTDFTLVDGSSTCSSSYSFGLPHTWLSRPDSHSNDTLRDIPPPLSRFADNEMDVLQDLTESILSCHINDSNVLKEKENPQQESLLSKWQFSVPRSNKTACCTQPCEPAAQKNVPRSSSSVGHNHNGEIQMHSHRTDSQLNCYADVGRRRRRTYPGVAYHLGHNGESKTSCRKSFSSGTLSSFFMQSLLSQAETSGRYHLEHERADISETRNHNSFGSTRSQPCSSSFYCAHTINPNITACCSTKTPLYSLVSNKSSEDVFPKCHNEHFEPAEVADQIFEDRTDQDVSSADLLEQSEVTESGFEEEMMEMENVVASTDNIHQKNLHIHVTPPSVCSSEESVTDGFHKGANAQPNEKQEKKQSSIVTVVGGYEQRSLHNKCISEDIVQNYQSATEPTSVYQKEQLEGQNQHRDIEEPIRLPDRPARRTSSQLTKTWNQTEKHLNKAASAKVKEHLKPGDSIPKDSEDSSDHWAKKRKMFKESRRWGSAEESSTSNITDESDTMNSEDARSVDMSLRDIEDRGFYTETFHSASWIYRGDDASPNETMQCLSNRPRPVAVRERTVKISKGMGEYPWGFRIQYSKPIIVTEVDTNGAAEEAGLKVGDYVLAVNGTDVTGVPHSEAVDLARQGPDLLILTIGSDIGRTPNTPKPACRGYLHKRTQSSFLKGWRKRWFVLRHDCCLYYYRNKRDEGKSHPLAVMRLEGAVVGPDISLGKPFVFKCSPVAGTRVYYFCATSNQEMRRWLEVLEQAVHPITQNHVWVDVTRHNSNLPPLAVKNPECLGLLNLLDRNKDSWVQHYCILKDGCLYFYASIRSTYAVGGIYLHGYTVREQPLGFKRSTIELKPPSEEFKVFYLCAENVNDNKRWIGAIRTSIGKWPPFHQALQDYMSRPPEETKM